MRKITSIILFAIISLVSIGTISAKESKGKSSESFTVKPKRFYKFAKGKFAESASNYSKIHYVRLYKRSHSVGKYKGVVTIRHAPRRIKRYTLPQPKYTWSIMEPQTIFFANADKDSDKELLIIERNMTGIGPSGSRYFYRTRVYDWNGKRFKHLEKVSKTIGRARTKARVKLILKRMLEKPAKYKKLSTAAYNRKVRIAARNKEFWVKMPTLVASNFVGKFSETKERTIKIISPLVEYSRDLDVIITDDGFADDSVRGERYKLKLKSDKSGVWYIISAQKAHRCWKGRGHTDYSTAPCS